MRCRSRHAVVLLVAVLAAGPSRSVPDARGAPAATQATQAVAPLDSKQQEKRVGWYRDAHFGMFIHWGLYAVPAGKWKGQEIGGIGEWIMNRARIPVKEYEQLARQFDPVKFNAEEWVQVARDAGMKYLVITSKHHDGFAMFASKASSYNIVDATPFKRDPMKELAEACKKADIRFCFYYSQAQDWHEPDGAGNTWDFGDDKRKNFDGYLQAKAEPQVRELLTQYGPIGLIWFDTPRMMTPERAARFANLVRTLQPDCLVNGRLGGAGDYRSMGDNKIPETVVEGAWETPATLNNTWGYKTSDQNWKSVEDLTFKLVDITSKGGNYLLNVGPTAEGVIPHPSVERLRKIGQWMKVNGESIYGARHTPFGNELKGKAWRCTSKPFDAPKGSPGRLYIHLFQWPQGKMELPGLRTPVRKAYLLADKDRGALKVAQADGRVTVTLPAEAPDKVDSVLVLETEGPVEVDSSVSTAPAASSSAEAAVGAVVAQSPDGSVSLRARRAALHGGTIKYEAGDKDAVGYWTEGSDWVSWDFTVTRPGEFTVEVTFACTGSSAGSEYVVTVGEQKLTGKVESTGSWANFTKKELGKVKLDKAGRYVLAVKPTSKPKVGVMNLKSITLRLGE